MTFKAGTRQSALALAQTAAALKEISARTGAKFRIVRVTTPGDRDLETPIERSAPDFFTRDLDEALRAGKIDLAVHSAKDLPDPMPSDIDWFWLPAAADRRDAWVSVGAIAPSCKAKLRIGVSSKRRGAYARRVFPSSRLLPIRGAIDSRIEQLRRGDFDAVLMAVAGLERLYGGTPPGVVVEPIALSELEPPEAQGRLAVTFRKGDRFMQAIRREFVKAVRFVSAGVGDGGTITIRGQADVDAADEVLYDELMALNRRSSSETVFRYVGKRAGRHSMKQPEITAAICDEARKGKRVVRLKGGDAGLFGRLAEETGALIELGIPFIVRPGVSALVAATTPNGLALTRRGEAAGFRVSTPRSNGARQPHVFFMASALAAETLAAFAPKTPYAIVYDACGPREQVVLGQCGKMAALPETGAPALVIAGFCGRPYPAPRRMLLTCSIAPMERLRLRFEDRGMRIVEWPMIELRPCAEAARFEPGRYDWIVITSPSAARIFLSSYNGDLRDLPGFVTCGAGTDSELRSRGLSSDLMPERDFSAAGMIEVCRRNRSLFARRRVLRLRSDLAGTEVAEALRALGAEVDDKIVYDNIPVKHEGPLPLFDDVFFASAAGVRAFLDAYGAAALRGKRVHAMGGPTVRELRRSLPRIRVFDTMLK